jgi:hypothetical protein
MQGELPGQSVEEIALEAAIAAVEDGGWQDVDMAIRVAMKLPIPSGDREVPNVLLTKQNIGTPRDSYDLPSDYLTQFEKLWQVG